MKLINRSNDPSGQKLSIFDLDPPIRKLLAALTGGLVTVTGTSHARQHSVTSGDDHTFPGGTDFLRSDGTFQTIAGGGDMLKASYDPANKNTQLAAVTDIAVDANLSAAAQDAISKKHTQGTDQALDNGGANQVTAADAKDAVTKKHSANGDTDLDATFEATFVKKADFNAQTILAATSDDTPAALEVTEQTVVGRITGGNIAALSVAQLATLALSAALPENTAVILDAALSADGKYSGIVEAGVAGAALAFGDVVYLAVADSRWELAKGDAAATSVGKIGICVLAAAADGDATLILRFGKVRADAVFPALTVGAPAFISAATGGAITNTAPSGTTNFVVRVIGYGNTADELCFEPAGTWVELA